MIHEHTGNLETPCDCPGCLTGGISDERRDSVRPKERLAGQAEERRNRIAAEPGAHLRRLAAPIEHYRIAIRDIRESVLERILEYHFAFPDLFVSGEAVTKFSVHDEVIFGKAGIKDRLIGRGWHLLVRLGFRHFPGVNC